MEEIKKVQIGGKAAALIIVLVIVGALVRLATFVESTDTELAKDVRAQLWLLYGDRLGKEVSDIRAKGTYGNVSSLLEKANPRAISIEQISRSEPLLSWSSSQKVIVRVRYRFPEDTRTQTEYMYFKHNSIAGWAYQHDTTVVVYYVNFF